MRHLSLCGDFFRECRRHFRTTGSILPSSRFLALALTSELRKRTGPARILEVGPGTGSVTSVILRELHPEDQFDVVEINRHFVDLLQQRIDQEELFRSHRDQINLIHAPVEELLGERVYDYIVSGLPLNNFSAAQVRRIFSTFDRLLKPGGTLTYYEYVLVRALKAPFLNRFGRRRLSCLGRVVNGYIDAYQFRRERIFANVPPAVVRHLRFNPAERTMLRPESSPSRTSSASR